MAIRRIKGLEAILGMVAFITALSILTLAAVLIFGIHQSTLLGDIDGEEDDPGCEDNNPCTKNYYRFGDSCHYLPAKNYEECESVCLVDNQGICNVGVCAGDCLGNCSTDTASSSCPPLLDDTQSPMNQTCILGGCTYRALVHVDPFFLGIPIAGSDLATQMCEACIHPEELLRECLEVSSFDEEEDDMLLCIYTFRCMKYSAAEMAEEHAH